MALNFVYIIRSTDTKAAVSCHNQFGFASAATLYGIAYYGALKYPKIARNEDLHIGA